MGNRESVQLLYFIFGLILKCAWAYRTGAPTRACGDMTPQHGSPINTDPAPFLVEVSKTQYAPNERIYVRIRGCGLAKFKGFMIQPRSAVYPSRPAFLGAFLRVRGTRYECVRSGAVLTHSSSEEKDSVTLTWIAPPGPAGHVVFRVTFVQSYTNYWVGINSPVIYDGVSRDLTIMQAFSLQSATDQSCLPTRRTTTTSTTTSVRTTTRRPTTRRPTTRRPTTAAPTTYLPTFPTEPFYTTTYLPSTTTTKATTTTTRRPTTTTARPTTTRKTTTTTTTLPPPPSTTQRRTTPTTRKSTTTEVYYYDYFLETSTDRQTKIKTEAQTTTTSTTTPSPTTSSTTRLPATTTTTTRVPITTMKFYEPTTTILWPTKPTKASTTLPPATTTVISNIADSGTTALFKDAADMWTTIKAAPETTRHKVGQILPTTYPTTIKNPTTRGQVLITNRQLPTTDTQMLIKDSVNTVTNGQLPVTDSKLPVTNEQILVTNKQIPVSNGQVTDRQIPVTNEQIVVTDRQNSLTNEQFIITDRQIPLTNGQSVVTDRQNPLTNGQSIVTDRQNPLTNGQSIVTDGLNPLTNGQVVVTDRQNHLTNGQLIVTDRQNAVINGQILVTGRQLPDTGKETFVTDNNFKNVDLVVSSAATMKSVTNTYRPISKSSVTIYPATKTDNYMPKTTYFYDYDMGRNDIRANQNYILTDRPYVPTNQNYIPTDRPYIPPDQRYLPTEQPYLPTEIIRNQSNYVPTTYKPFVPSTRTQNYVPTTAKPMHLTTRRIVYLPTTKSSFNPTPKIDAYLTFPPQTYTPDQSQKLTTDYVSPKTTVNVAGTRTSTTKTVLSTKETVDTVLTADQECGVTHGCFDDCRNGVCNFIVSWKPERNVTRFEIKTKPMVSGQYWAAVGFSNDKMMGLDSVTECITEGEKIQVYQSYNLDYYRNMRLLSPKLGITEEFGSLNNGILTCSFTRKNFVEGEKDVFDLSKDWHMMFAEGPAVNGVKIPHRYDVVPPVTSERMDLQRYPPMHETYDYRSARKENIIKVTETKEPALVSIQQKRIRVDQSCGSTKSCFQDCDNEGCKFIVSWEGATDHVMFTVRAVLNDSLSQWIAIAFSEDDRMGGDSVIQCVSNEEGAIDVRHSYNDNKNNVRVEQANLGLRNTSARFVDGVFECSFVRDRFVENERIFDLDRDWNLLFAHGKSKKGIMLPHTLAEKPHVSDNAVDFSRSAHKPDFLSITASSFFIKIHAALMIFAWILCASVASVIGRYFQPYWWGEKMFGSKTWVKVHWLFVMITCSAVIAGFAVIFVGVGGISELFEHPTYTFNGTHPIMGLVVSLLALLNPLLLCLRPSEDSSSRAFFNCLYWLVEIGAHVLAVVTIYAGFGLASFLVPSFFTFLIIGFTVYQILVLLFMEALKSYDAKKTIERKKIYLYEMQIRPWNGRKNNSLAAYMDLNHTSKGLKNSVLATHLLLLSALSTTMIVLIIINDRYP